MSKAKLFIFSFLILLLFPALVLASDLKIKILQNAKSGHRTSDEIIFNGKGIRVNSLALKNIDKTKIEKYKSYFAGFSAPSTGPCEAGYFLFASNSQNPSKVIIACNKGAKFAELMDQVHKMKLEGN